MRQGRHSQPGCCVLFKFCKHLFNQRCFQIAHAPFSILPYPPYKKGGHPPEKHIDFNPADVFGRCIGLKVLSKDAEVNKEEILKYSQDGSKAVRQQVYKILCSKEGWEERWTSP